MKRSEGQAVMEYIIITAFIGVACMVIMKNFGQTLKTRYEELKERLSQEELKIK